MSTTAQDLLYQIMPRLKNTDGSNFYDALNATIQVINNRLWILRSSMIIGSFTSPLGTGVGGDKVTLPTDFLGFAGDPVIVERKRPLLPLPLDLRLELVAAGTPAYYLASYQTLTVYPPPSEALTFEARYFQAPAQIDGGADLLPYSGVFDLVIRDAVVEAANLGMYATSRPEFVAMIATQVDRLVKLRIPPRVTMLHPLTGRQ